MSVSNNILSLGRIQQKRATSTVLASSSYIALPGELVVATDTGEIKVGDGVKTWSELPSVGGSGGDTSALEDRIEALENVAGLGDSTITDHDYAEDNNAVKGESVYTEFTTAQSNNIRDGSFTGLYPCDEWSFENVTYTFTNEADVEVSQTFSGNIVLGGLDYFKRVPGVVKALPAHYALVFAKSTMFTARMNSTDTTEGGYPASEMFTTTLRRADAIFKACFGANHVISATMMLPLVNNATLSSYKYYTVKSFLMFEPMIFGSYQYSILKNVSYDAFNQSGVRPILPAIALNSELKKISAYYWLQDVYSASEFAGVYSGGSANYYDASNVYAVRPAALIY